MPEIEIPVKGFKCNKCGHEWIPRSQKPENRPVECPSCKSGRWDDPPKLGISFAETKRGKSRKK